MKQVEASAPTREEAIQKALEELGCEMYEVDDIKILDEGSKGLFGFGARSVRVVVSLEGGHEAPARKREAQPRREERGEEHGEERGGDDSRDDKPARIQQLLRNYEFFGAPAGLFFSLDRQFDKGQWAHLGMFMASFALAAEDMGLATCMQEAWAARAKTVSAFLGLPETEQLYCGMALGYADKSAKVNELRSSREPVDAFAHFITE